MDNMTARKEQLVDKLGLLIPINGLPEQLQSELLAHAEMLAVKCGEFVFRQDDRDDYTFYLLDGKLDLYSNEELVQQLEGGTENASHALAQLQPRQLSAKARTAVQLLRVDRVILDRLAEQAGVAGGGEFEVSEVGVDSDSDWMTRLLQSELFARVPAANIQHIFARMDPIQVAAGDLLVNQGAIGDYYYIIQTGRCEVSRKTSATGQPIKLAELGPGDTFGEEALVANSRCNETIVMLTDGELMRLTKDDFVELIQRPLMSSVSYAEGLELEKLGAHWLDVRFPEEHKKFAIPASLNVPLNVLRSEILKLDRDGRYLVYCDNGSRSSVAAFLMNERGFDAVYLNHGLAAINPAEESIAADATIDDDDLTIQSADVIDFPPAGITMAPIPASQLTESEKVSARKDLHESVALAHSDDSKTLEVDIRASVLKTELAKANMQLEEARRLKAEAEEAKRLAEQSAAQQLHDEREKLEATARQANDALHEAQRLKAEVEAAKSAADAEVENRRMAEEERIRALEEAAQQRLHQEKKKLEEAYKWKEEELENIRQMKEEAEQQLATERQKLLAESTEARERLAEAKRIERDVEQTRIAAAEEAEVRHQKQIEMEERLRSEIKSKIDGERRKLEAEFARNAEQLELARREKQAAEAARIAAADEAERIIVEYREAHEKIRAAELANLGAERSHLEAEAAKVREDLEAAASAKADAVATRQAAEAQLADLRSPDAQAVSETDATEATRREEIAVKLAELEDADVEAKAAQRAHNQAEAAHEAIAGNLERHEHEEAEIEARFERDVSEWVAEQAAVESSDAQQRILANQREHMQRIMQRAKQAHLTAEINDQNMVDEVAKSLKDRDNQPK